ALFEDDSLLTVGPDSRVEVNEYLYDPNRDLRSTVISLGKGTLRALVGKVFEGVGSQFEIHTANATAAARGTHFVVWVEEAASGAGRPAALTEGELVAVPVGASGIANIGQTGFVAFTAEGVTVIVKPGMYSVAAPGEPPIQPATIAAKAPQALIQAVTQTQLQDMALPESPAHVLALLGDNVLSDPLATTTGLLADATGTLGDVTDTLGNTAESVLDTANSLTTDVTSTLTSTVTTTTTAVPGIIGIFTNDTVTALSAGGGGILPGGAIDTGTIDQLLGSDIGL
ncbi:MAG: FecR domain-containing protein, partial [bacterium]